MSAKRQSLSAMPGWAESAKAVETSLRGNGNDWSFMRKGTLRAAGFWIPPASIDQVTLPLLRALYLGLERHWMHLDAIERLSATVIPIDVARGSREGRPLSYLARRARGEFTIEWFNDTRNGGDPTL